MLIAKQLQVLLEEADPSQLSFQIKYLVFDWSCQN